eukprot:227402-Chlamydomonas_euryale.AAC.2
MPRCPPYEGLENGLRGWEEHREGADGMVVHVCPSPAQHGWAHNIVKCVMLHRWVYAWTDGRMNRR